MDPGHFQGIREAPKGSNVVAFLGVAAGDPRGDPWGILGGSWSFSGDPRFWHVYIPRGKCRSQGDPVRPLASV